jgi:biopolymer transport protein ExbD
MRIGSPLSVKKARIEIIPLIDVMFFLLAAFMLVSLSMQRLRTIKMDLPSAVAARSTQKPDMLELKVSESGDVSVEGKRISLPDLHALVTEKLQANTNYPVYIKSDNRALHGMVINILDTVKHAGARKVSFALDTTPVKK